MRSKSLSASNSRTEVYKQKSISKQNTELLTSTTIDVNLQPVDDSEQKDEKLDESAGTHSESEVDSSNLPIIASLLEHQAKSDSIDIEGKSEEEDKDKENVSKISNLASQQNNDSDQGDDEYNIDKLEDGENDKIDSNISLESTDIFEGQKIDEKSYLQDKEYENTKESNTDSQQYDEVNTSNEMELYSSENEVDSSEMIDEYVSVFSNERKEEIHNADFAENADNSDIRSSNEDENPPQHSNIYNDDNLDTEQNSKKEESRNKLQSDYSISEEDADDLISLYDYTERSSFDKMAEEKIFDMDSEHEAINYRKTYDNQQEPQYFDSDEYDAAEAQEFHRPEVDISSNMAFKSSSNVANDAEVSANIQYALVSSSVMLEHNSILIMLVLIFSFRYLLPFPQGR